MTALGHFSSDASVKCTWLNAKLHWTQFCSLPRDSRNSLYVFLCVSVPVKQSDNSKLWDWSPKHNMVTVKAPEVTVHFSPVLGLFYTADSYFTCSKTVITKCAEESPAKSEQTWCKLRRYCTHTNQRELSVPRNRPENKLLWPFKPALTAISFRFPIRW